MMSLAPPYYVFQGVPVFADAADPYQYYYLPNRPHFAPDDQGRPAVRFLALKQDPAATPAANDDVVGFLYFDTSLDWPAATLKKVARQIQTERKLDQEPRLVPLLYRTGTVRLMFLDKMTPDPTKPAQADDEGGGVGADGVTPAGGEWVTMLATSGTSSLYGENRAIFSVELTQQATTLMYEAFDGFIPAGVVYDLTFDALQPAFNIHVTADWSQVYHFIRERHSAKIIFFSSDIDDTVSSLVDNKVIKVESAIEGVGEEGMEGQYNEVRKQLLSFVMDTFFKPTPNPFKPDTAIQDGVVGVLRDLRDVGQPLNVGYQRVTLDASELRTLTIDYDVARAVQRHIAPQGHLNLLFSDFNLKKQDVVTVVDTRDSIFRTQEFTVAVSAPFGDDAIEAVTVDVAYGEASPPPPNADLWSFFFKPDTAEQKRADWYDPAVGTTVQYRYQTVFSSTKSGPELKLQSDWQPSQGSIIMVTPDEMYRRRELEIQAQQSFPFNLYPGIEVQLRYQHAGTDWTYQSGALLDSHNLTWKPSFRIHQDWPDEVEYRLEFLHGPGNLTTDWQPTTADRIDITDPRKNLFTAHVIVAGDRTQIQQIVVDLSYSDLDHDIFESQSWTLTSENFDQAHDFVFPRADPSLDRYTYSQVIVMTNGDVISTGEVQSDSVHLLVGPVFAKKWEVHPSLVGPPLSQSGLDKITLTLSYADEANSYTAAKTVVFTGVGDGPGWPLELRDPSLREYTYTVVYEDTSGFDKVFGPATGTDTFLFIPSTPPTT